MKKLPTGPRVRTRGLDVDGNVHIPVETPRPRARAGVKCTWREACKAADYVLEHFGEPTDQTAAHQSVLATSVRPSVPKQSADRQPDAQPTNRRINRHQTAGTY